MKTHEPDPTREPGLDSWDEVHQQVGELGDRLKETYRKVADETGPTEDEVRQAVVTLAGAWEQIATSLSTILEDPEMRRRLKLAAASLAGALGARLGGLDGEMPDDVEEE